MRCGHGGATAWWLESALPERRSRDFTRMNPRCHAARAALLTAAGFELGFSEQTERRRARGGVLAAVDAQLAVDRPDV